MHFDLGVADLPAEVDRIVGLGATAVSRAHDEIGFRWCRYDPKLVALLREHLDIYGPGPGGRLFRSRGGNVVGASTYSRAWREARPLALTAVQADSPIGGRPYDLRHAAVSLWLNGGVPATEVAERAGIRWTCC